MAGEQDNLLVLCKLLYGISRSGLSIRIQVNKGIVHDDEILPVIQEHLCYGQPQGKPKCIYCAPQLLAYPLKTAQRPSGCCVM